MEEEERRGEGGAKDSDFGGRGFRQRLQAHRSRLMMLSWRSWRGEVGLKWCQNECEGKERLKNIRYFFFWGGGD